MTPDDARPTPLDAFLDRLIRGDDLSPAAFLEAHPELAHEERRLVLRLCREDAPPRRAPEPQAAGSQPGEADSPPVERIGAFRLGRRLGAGGMGAVFLATDEALGREVAVKILAPDLVGTGAQAERFLREVRAAARLRHPNIVTVHAAGEQNGLRYMVMELVPGASLHEVLAKASERGTRPPAADVVRWGMDVARALEAAHEAGIIHRDVKPSNIRITPDGRAVLVDFGLARDSAAATLTEPGVFHGSPQYASPEQVGLPGVPIDGRTDVYSLAATLYECLTGIAPLRGETRQQLFHDILSREPVAPRRLDPSIPRDLETVILAALDKDPRRRPATAAALAADLEAVRDGRPVSVRPLSGAGRMLRWARRHPARAGLAAALVVGIPLVAALGGFILANLSKISKGSEVEHESRLEELLEDAFLEYGEGDPDRALAGFTEARRWAPESKEAQAGYALALIATEQPAAALAFLEGLRPDSSGEYWNQRIRMQALASSSRGEEADALTHRMPPPTTPVDWFVSGILALYEFEHGKRAAALTAFNQLRLAVWSEKAPTALYHYELGHAAWHAGKHEEARELAKAVEGRWPESPERNFAVGRMLLDAHPKASLDALAKAAAHPPRALHASDLIASQLAESGRGDATLALARKVALATIARDPSRAKSHVVLGIVEVEAHDPPAALRSFDEAIRLDPRYAVAHRKRAEVLVFQNAFADAIAPAREAIRLAPRDGRAWNVLGVALADPGDQEESAKAHEQAVKLEPDNPEFLCNWGRMLLRRGEFARAAEQLRRGDEIGSKNPKWRYASKAWAADAEKRVALEERLEAVRRRQGPNPTGEELVRIARLVCRPKKLFAEASALYARAFEEAPELESRRDPDHRREAAAVSVAAGLGKGADAPSDAAKRAQLRAQALAWFDHELRSLEAEAREGESLPEELTALAKGWTADPALAATRATDGDGLTTDEVRTWRDLWKRCGALAGPH